MRSTEIVAAFWNDVWYAHEAAALGRFAAADIVIEASGRRISGVDSVKRWVQQFLDHVDDLHIYAVEPFQNEDGTRVTSVWSVADGKLQHGRVEQVSFEPYHSLLTK
ncbi:nuclear transport factor 2 family protein [Mycobacterium sp. 134]|uniref:nuclear transport factor 2 family protein n=1 Tax=Mycobacterium sp. 134 TaxID=3400425 RepID=UPI003AB025EC